MRSLHKSDLKLHHLLRYSARFNVPVGSAWTNFFPLLASFYSVMGGGGVTSECVISSRSLMSVIKKGPGGARGGITPRTDFWAARISSLNLNDLRDDFFFFLYCSQLLQTHGEQIAQR